LRRPRAKDVITTLSRRLREFDTVRPLIVMAKSGQRFANWPALPHARLVMLARCGHLPEVELPSRVNDLIAAHLS
jgi:hypothetical protein